MEQELKYFENPDVYKNNLGRPLKYDFFKKLLPGSYWHIPFKSESQLVAIRSSLRQFVKHNHPEWKTGVRKMGEEIHIIRFS